MKIAAVSDLHGVLPKIARCDLVLIAGDVIPLGIQTDRTQSIVWFFRTFLPWIKELPCENVYMVAGNHDFLLEENYPLAKALEYLSSFKFHYLLNNTETYLSTDGDKYTIYGSPQCHQFGNWPFMHPESYLDGLYSNVAEGIDIWITHDTPKLGDLDLLPPSRWNPKSVHAGGESLAKAILKVKPSYVFCGHLHTCKDKFYQVDNTKIYNVSILDNDYNNAYKPTYVEIESKQ